MLSHPAAIDPRCGEGVAGLAGAMLELFGRGSLDRRYREIATLRTTARCACDSRVATAFFARVALRETEMAELAYGGASDPAWSESERTLIRLVDELHDTSRITDALWTELRRHWSDMQLVELVVLVGFYHTISFLVNGLGMEIDAWEVMRR